ANGHARWDRAVKKAKENRDEERLKKLLTDGPPTYRSTYWESDVEKGHGRIEKRTCTAMPIGELPSQEGWIGIQSIARIVRERTKDGVTSREVAYYIASLKPVAAIIGEVAREHWGVEGEHRFLDVVFRQDNSRYRNRIGARNL